MSDTKKKIGIHENTVRVEDHACVTFDSRGVREVEQTRKMEPHVKIRRLNKRYNAEQKRARHIENQQAQRMAHQDSKGPEWGGITGPDGKVHVKCHKEDGHYVIG